MPEMPNSSLSELSVSVTASVNPRPVIISLIDSETAVSGMREPVVWVIECDPPNLSKPYPMATSS